MKDSKMLNTPIKQQIDERNARLPTEADVKAHELADEQSFYNGVISELALVKAGVPFVPRGVFGDRVTSFVEEAYRAMTDYYHHVINDAEPESAQTKEGE